MIGTSLHQVETGLAARARNCSKLTRWSPFLMQLFSLYEFKMDAIQWIGRHEGTDQRRAGQDLSALLNILALLCSARPAVAARHSSQSR